MARNTDSLLSRLWPHSNSLQSPRADSVDRSSGTDCQGFATQALPRDDLVHQVNPEWYLNQYDDVRAQGGDPAEHFHRYGYAEGRTPNELFDRSWYVTNYPDVAADGSDPFLHFLGHGWREGRRPGPQTDADEYFLRYPRHAPLDELIDASAEPSLIRRDVPLSSVIPKLSERCAARPFGAFEAAPPDQLHSIMSPIGAEVRLDRTKPAHFAYGWHDVESSGCWTKSARSGFTFALDPSSRPPRHIRFTIAFLKSMPTPQRLQCWAGPVCLFNGVVDRPGTSELEMNLPQELADPGGVYNLRFHFSYSRPPLRDDGMRRLGFMLRALRITDT